MSAASHAAARRELTEKQRQILSYLHTNDDQTYFKSRLIGDELDLSAKEVGANMPAVDGVEGIEVEQWGYSSSTTWKVTGRN